MEPLLFTPLKLDNKTMKNRIVVSPMCQYSADNGSATAWHHQHLGVLSYSGAGLVMVEATGVEARGRITPQCLGLYSNDNEEALRSVLKDVRTFSKDVLFGIQLAHAGRKGSTDAPWLGGYPLSKDKGAWQCIAPSAIPFDANWHVPLMMDEKMMEDVITAFVESAKRAVRLGFDVIEVHSAHGYLLHEFLSPLANKRVDQYGGSLQNRIRFPLAVFKAVRKVVPAGIPVGVRISATDWQEGGWTLEDSVMYSATLKQSGAAYICVSSGAIIPRVSIPVGPGYQVPLAREIKNRTGIATRAVGMITTPKQAEEILQSGSADCVALARAFLDEPRWGWRAADEFGINIESPNQYVLSRPPKWKSPWNSGDKK